MDAYSRTYACTCTTRTITNPGPAPNPEPDAPYDASTPWSCAGHADLVGVDRAAVSAALDDLSAVPAPMRRWPGFAAARLCDAAGGDKASLLDLLAEIALTDPSDIRVARAVRALAHFPLEPAAGRLATTPVSRWLRADPDVPSESISLSVARVFGPRVEPLFGDADALRALHALAVSPPGVDFVLYPAVWADPAWAVGSVEAIVAAAPDAWKNLIQALKSRRDDAAAVARRLVGLGIPSADILAVAKRWPGPAAAAVAAAIAAPLPRPTREIPAIPDARIPAAVRHLTTGEGLPTLRDDRLPLDAVQRLWSELAGTPDAEALSRSIAALMGTTSIDLDHAILRFFENHPGAPGGEVLADALRMRADAFPVGGACPIPGERRDARQALLRACLRWGPVPADLLPVFRAEALTPGRADAILMGLRRRDAAWVDTNLNAILFASPDAGPATWSELLDEGWDHARALDWILAHIETVDLPTWRILLGYYVSDPALRAELDAKLVARA